MNNTNSPDKNDEPRRGAVETHCNASLHRDASLHRILRNISIAAAIFAMILCVLIVVNFIQIKRADPLNSQVMKVLVDRMHANPADGQLRQEIREIDLLSRKAFFTNQWQVRMGGYLLFFSILVMIICAKSIELLHKTLPAIPGEVNTDFWISRKINRAW